jgi:hypothetical protein
MRMGSFHCFDEGAHPMYQRNDDRWRVSKLQITTCVVRLPHNRFKRTNIFRYQ